MTPQVKPGRDRHGAAEKLSALHGLGKAELDAIEVLGFQLYQQGRNREADTIFDGLIALNREMYEGFAGKGALALAELRLEEALSWLEEAEERNPDDAAVQANLGETLLRLNHFEEAAVHFENALALDPDERDPAANRARAILAGMSAIAQQTINTEPEEQLPDDPPEN